MTRTNKGNDRNHSAIADGSALPEERLPRYFAKHGHVDADPKGVKKQGGGKGNWYTSPPMPSLHPPLTPTGAVTAKRVKTMATPLTTLVVDPTPALKP